MILSQSELREEVERGEIRFDPPLEDRQWGEASVDLSLGLKFTKLRPAPGTKFSMAKGIGVISQTGLWIQKTLRTEDEFGKKETIVLGPNEFILALKLINDGEVTRKDLRASWAELQRVQWPDRRQVGQATAVVLGFVVVAGIYLGLADALADQIVDWII